MASDNRDAEILSTVPLMNTERDQLQWSNVKSLHSDRFIESNIRLNENNYDDLHPEARRRMQMLGLLPSNTNDEHKQETNHDVDLIRPETIDNEDPAILADKYMMKHELYELFKTLTTKIVFNRPSDPIGFMIDDLEKQANAKMRI